MRDHLPHFGGRAIGLVGGRGLLEALFEFGQRSEHVPLTVERGVFLLIEQLTRGIVGRGLGLLEERLQGGQRGELLIERLGEAAEFLADFGLAVDQFVGLGEVGSAGLVPQFLLLLEERADQFEALLRLAAEQALCSFEGFEKQLQALNHFGLLLLGGGETGGFQLSAGRVDRGAGVSGTESP